MPSDVRKGCFLVAAPALQDPNFSRSVVLVCDHGPDGTMGLIVNRPLALPPDGVLAGVPGITLPGVKIHQGGPVQADHLLLLHGLTKLGLDAHPVCPGLFLGGDLEALKEALGDVTGPPALRYYLGYAGWSAGQLEAEIAEGAWLVREARAEDVFCADPAALWARLSGARRHLDPYAPPAGPELN